MAIRVVQSELFKRWLKKLKDERGKAKIISRVHQLACGLPGDVKYLGKGVSELRIHSGPGYRVYFHQSGDELVLLLIAGSKSTQSRDITKAQSLLMDWQADGGNPHDPNIH